MRKMILAGLCALFFGQAAMAQDPEVQPRSKSVVIRQEGYQEQQEPELKDLSFRQRIRIGGGISGLSIGNPTSIGVSPMVGYQATKQTIVGIGGTYQYSSWKFYDNFGNTYRQSFNTMGYRAFVMQNLPILQDLIGGGYLQAEIEKYESLSPSFSYRPSFLVGAGLGNPRGFNLTVLYDFNYKNGINPTNGNPYSLYGSPLVLRVGGFFF